MASPRKSDLPQPVQVRADVGLVTLQVGAEDRLVFTLGDAWVLVRALRSAAPAALVTQLETAIKQAREYQRNGRRFSALGGL
jgi:hypothetical protein